MYLNLERELLNAISKSDYVASSRLLEEILSQGKADEIAASFSPIVEERPDLRFRDHVASFLSFEPVYCSLEVPSYRLLENANGAESRYEAAYEMYKYVSGLVDSHHQSFNIKSFRIKRTTSSAYAALLPAILQQRTQEITNCNVPYTIRTASGKMRYYIGNLLKTAYGESIIHSLPKYPEFVVNEPVWNQIADVLNELGFDSETMLDKIPSELWYNTVKSLESNRLDSPDSTEVSALRLLAKTMQASDRGEIVELSMSHLRIIRSLGTRQYNKEIIDVLPNANNQSLELILEILVDTRDSVADEIIGEFLNSEDAKKRVIAARSLSRLTALESVMSITDPFQASSIDIAGLLGSSPNAVNRRLSNSSALALLARNQSPLVRRDLVKILAGTHGVETRKLFFQLLLDPDQDVRLEILSQIDNLPPQLARDILTAALDNSNEEIVSLAEEIISDRNAIGH